MTEMVDASRLPPWEALPETEAITDRVEALPLWRAPLTRIYMPAFSAVAVRFARTDALRDAAILGLSCELYRSKHGEYPDSLDELVPEFLDAIPPDPFTGKPFVYKKRPDGEGFIVYSVGPNLADDGGVSDRATGKDDIAWERKPLENVAGDEPEGPGDAVPAVSE